MTNSNKTVSDHFITTTAKDYDISTQKALEIYTIYAADNFYEKLEEYIEERRNKND